MATPLFSNFARTTLAAGITNVAVTMNVAPGTGALFPSPGAGQYFPMVIVNSSGAKEVVYCTSRAVDALTITRAQEGTTGLAFNAGDVCGLRITSSSLADLLTLVGSPAAVEVAVASAATTNIGAANSMSVSISGTANITAFDTVASGTKRLCRATGAFTLVHSANLACPGAANIVAAVGDLFWAETSGAGVWYIGPYQRATGQALVVTAATPQIIVPVRQTCLSMSADANGYPAPTVVGGTGVGFTTLTLSSLVVATAANGFGTSGAVDVVGQSSSLSWTGLSTNGIMYLYADIAAGVLSAVSSTLAPTYRWGGADVVTSGQFTFNIQEMIGKVGNGAAAVQTNRVCLGEVTVAAGVISAITWYALQGRYDSGYTATLPGAAAQVSKNSNLGIIPEVANLVLECTTADIGYAVGDRIVNPQWCGNASANTGGVIPIVASRNTIGFATASVANYYTFNKAGGGGGSILTAASWKYKLTCSRGW